ncbi:hypothetical protein [Deinococcus rufus]|uniref:Uncharacterized protein n=1 Tax=Deinococcus rufus TaxID=2136097 RepID=A0ABV7Z7Q9_9DEIO
MTDPTIDAAERIQQLGQVQDALVREIARLKQTTLEQEAQLWVRRPHQALSERRLWWPVTLIRRDSVLGGPVIRTPRGVRITPRWTFCSRHGSQRPYGVIQYVTIGPVIVRLGYRPALEEWHADRSRHFRTMWTAARGRAHEHALRELARAETRALATDLP